MAGYTLPPESITLRRGSIKVNQQRHRLRLPTRLTPSQELYLLCMSRNAPQGCLGRVLGLFGASRPQRSPIQQKPKVQVNRYFVSDAEAAFFRVLVRVVGERGHVLSQVSLRQLVWFPGTNRTNPGRATWQNKVAAKTVDFVVCDPATLRPLVVIELDEPSHAEPQRQTRDEEVDEVLVAARLPVLRVLTSRSYETRELSAALEQYLTPARPTTRRQEY